METRPPLPPFSLASAVQKVRLAEDGWNTRDAAKVAMAYTPDTKWRNRAEFANSRAEAQALIDRLPSTSGASSQPQLSRESLAAINCLAFALQSSKGCCAIKKGRQAFLHRCRYKWSFRRGGCFRMPAYLWCSF